MKRGMWTRHIATLPAFVGGAWYGVETGSRGALVVAGAAAVGWIVWPETARFIAWRRRRRGERARRRADRAIERAERQMARAERAKQRADQRPGSRRRTRRAERLVRRAERSLARAARAKERVQGLDGTWREERPSCEP